MSVKIDQPYPILRDKTGFPLDGGLIYIGVAGLNPETNPIQCYFDEDFTLVAPQPLRTINGYISRNCSPSNIFLKVAECSITIKDRFRITQYTDLHFQLSNFGELKLNQIFDDNGLTLEELNNGIESIADLLAINNPKNGSRVFVKSYYAGLNKGARSYYYFDSSRVLENDSGTVINGWVCEKKEFTIWDFGYKVGDSVLSTEAIKAAFLSPATLRLERETLNAHSWTEVSNSTNKIILGDGITSSIIYGLKFVFSGSVLIAKDFKINNPVGNVNYAIVATSYDNIEIDSFESENTYDGVSIWGANSEDSQAVVRNSVSIKAARIGFTSDLGAKNIVFENNKSIDCRQGVHIEDTSNFIVSNHENIRCGSSSPTPLTDQPLIYAGGYRFHKIKNGRFFNSKNTAPSGTSIDWFGGGGEDFKALDLIGVKFLTDDVANLDPESTFTYKDFEFKECSDFSFVNQLNKSILAGKWVFDDIKGGDINLSSGANYLSKTNQIDLLYLDKLNVGRTQCDTAITNSTLYINETIISTQYFNMFSGFAFFELGDLKYNWLTGDESQYPTLGFRFIGNNAKSFNLKSFTSSFRGGGSQISFESINASTFKGGYIGSIVATNGPIDSFSGVDYDALNIIRIDRLMTKGISVTTAQISSATSAINTTGKYLSRIIMDSSVSPNRFYISTGSLPTSAWLRVDDNNIFIVPS